MGQGQLGKLGKLTAFALNEFHKTTIFNEEIHFLTTVQLGLEVLLSSCLIILARSDWPIGVIRTDNLFRGPR